MKKMKTDMWASVDGSLLLKTGAPTEDVVKRLRKSGCSAGQEIHMDARHILVMGEVNIPALEEALEAIVPYTECGGIAVRCPAAAMSTCGCGCCHGHNAPEYEFRFGEWVFLGARLLKEKAVKGEDGPEAAIPLYAVMEMKAGRLRPLRIFTEPDDAGSFCKKQIGKASDGALYYVEETVM